MWFNLIGFNVCWLGLVIYGNDFIVVAFAWLVAHFYFTKQRFQEMLVVLSVTVLGSLVDSFLSFQGVFIFQPESLIIPWWLLILWLCFSATLNHSLKFLTKYTYLPLVVGAIFPPLSYLAGAKLGAVSLGYSQIQSFILLSVIWCGLLMVFVQLQKYLAQEISLHAK